MRWKSAEYASSPSILCGAATVAAAAAAGRSCWRVGGSALAVAWLDRTLDSCLLTLHHLIPISRSGTGGPSARAADENPSAAAMKRRPGLQGLARAQQERVRTPPPPESSSIFAAAAAAAAPPLSAACRLRRTPSAPAPAPPRRPQRQFNAVGEQVAETKAAVMRGQMAHFKESLEEFAAKHRADIRSNPEFRWGGAAWLAAECCIAGWPGTGPWRASAGSAAVVRSPCRAPRSHPPAAPPPRRSHRTCRPLRAPPVPPALPAHCACPPQGPVPPHVRHHRRGPAGLQQGRLEPAAGPGRCAGRPSDAVPRAACRACVGARRHRRRRRWRPSHPRLPPRVWRLAHRLGGLHVHTHHAPPCRPPPDLYCELRCRAAARESLQAPSLPACCAPSGTMDAPQTFTTSWACRWWRAASPPAPSPAASSSWARRCATCRCVCVPRLPHPHFSPSPSRPCAWGGCGWVGGWVGGGHTCMQDAEGTAVGATGSCTAGGGACAQAPPDDSPPLPASRAPPSSPSSRGPLEPCSAWVPHAPQVLLFAKKRDIVDGVHAQFRWAGRPARARRAGGPAAPAGLPVAARLPALAPALAPRQPTPLLSAALQEGGRAQGAPGSGRCTRLRAPCSAPPPTNPPICPQEQDRAQGVPGAGGGGAAPGGVHR